MGHCDICIKMVCYVKLPMEFEYDVKSRGNGPQKTSYGLKSGLIWSRDALICNYSLININSRSLDFNDHIGMQHILNTNYSF